MISKSSSIPALQVFRGLAACYVAFYHVYIILMEPQYGSNTVFRDFSRHGFLGVAFFFVLSGFIISLAHVGDIGRQDGLPSYLRKRFVRVYPTYWVYLTGFILASAFGIGYPDFSWSSVNLISSYILFPLSNDVTLPIKVAWTLVYEVTFYAFFAVLIFSRFCGALVFGVWLLSVISNIYFIKSDVYILTHWNLYFMAGILAYALYRLEWPKLIWPALAVGVLCLTVYALNADSISRIRDIGTQENSHLHFLLVVSFCLLVLGAALLDQKFEIRWPRLLIFIGDASYSIYLVHSSIISIVVIIARKLKVFDSIPVELLFIVIFAVSVFGGAIAYIIVERPILSFLRSRWR
ncbi:Uncharacterized protein conserved in bacteria [Pannonibacter phragmitetus]|uniref:Uncharacterized protein conserved in bacteria n=1 Tax=Pannonibacter phragmitetus TaxID=121719 RepID=A0A378ZYF3_9HYPH|nr:acyltransferase [Pannonibacter phragmitetus]SUB02266.1 Uncharacterized protein conserved in bacteria [Pannonibacter phragmitetus]